MEANSVTRKLEFVVEQQNYTDYIVLCQRNALGRVHYVLSGILPILMAGALGAFISLLTNNSTVETVLAVALIAILGWVCGYTGLIIACLIPRPKYVTQGGCFLGKASLELRPNELCWEHQSGARSFFPWSAVKSIKRRNKTLVLMLDNAMGIVLPVNVFYGEHAKVDIQSREQFISYVESKISHDPNQS